MRNRLTHHRGRIVAAVAALSLVAVACGEDDNDAADTTAAPATETSEAMNETTMMGSDTTMAGGDAGAMAPTGSACGAVPTDGEGSFSGMADDPAATAASQQPGAVDPRRGGDRGRLVDTLNGAGPVHDLRPGERRLRRHPRGRPRAP